MGKGIRATGRGLKQTWNYTYPKVRDVSKGTLQYIVRVVRTGRGLIKPLKWMNQNRITTITLGLGLGIASGIGYGVHKGFSWLQTPYTEVGIETSNEDKSERKNDLINKLHEPLISPTPTETLTQAPVESYKNTRTLVQRLSRNTPAFKTKIQEYDIEVYSNPNSEYTLMRIVYSGKAHADRSGNYQKNTNNFLFNTKIDRVDQAFQINAFGVQRNETELNEADPNAQPILAQATEQYKHFLQLMQEKTLFDMIGKPQVPSPQKHVLPLPAPAEIIPSPPPVKQPYSHHSSLSDSLSRGIEIYFTPARNGNLREIMN